MNANSIAKRLGLASMILFASLGGAMAQHRYAANPGQYFNLYDPAQSAMNFSRQDQLKYGRSGTRGRDGLGAAPFHPEGPGNVTD